MKLSADVIFNELKEYIPVEMIGYKNENLAIIRPEFLLGEDKSFLVDHLYIVRSERIPRRLVAEKGSVVICIGDTPQMAFLQERCCFIKAPSDTDPLYLSNLVNSIFNRYDLWDESIHEILNNSSDIDTIIQSSFSIFKNPILLLDSNFKVLSRAGYSGVEEPLQIFEGENLDALSLSALTKFIEEKGLMMDVKEPMLLDILGHSLLCINLFSSEEYVGSLTIEFRESLYNEGQKALLIHLSKVLVAAFKNNSQITSDSNILRRILSDMINERPLDVVYKRYLDSIDIRKNLVCCVFQIDNRLSQLPAEFICNKIENMVPRSTTFKSHSTIISFIEEQDIESIKSITDSLDISVGISNKLSNFYNSRLYYLQACAALENGLLIEPSKKFYNFDDYALAELIMNAQDELPIDMYYPAGLSKLFEHDKNSSAEYVKTLRTYLNNSMRITSTAKALNIHRSTLIERIGRISKILGDCLDDPDKRLQMQIVLKAIEIREEIIRKTEKI